MATKRIEVIAAHLIPNATSGSCPVKQQTNCPVANAGKAWPRFAQGGPIRVCVTGAAGNIAYSLIFMISSGQMFGPHIPVFLQLLDIPQMEGALKGVEMEIADCAFPLVKGIITTSDPKIGFADVDVAIFCGAFPRKKGMERKDLLSKNADIFKVQGKALNQYASRNVKCLVVGNPANTNCLILMTNAPDIPRQNFTALTRLDHNRAKAQLAQKLGVPIADIHNAVIWGNHSATQYPDISNAFVSNYTKDRLVTNIRSAVNNDKWLHEDFITTVQQRGAEVIKARNSSSAASAAYAIVCHIRDWVCGTPSGEMVSMAVCSDGSYNVPKGLIYSFPCVCAGGEWNIVQGLKISEFSQKKLDVTTNELLEEQKDAMSLLSQ